METENMMTDFKLCVNNCGSYGFDSLFVCLFIFCILFLVFTYQTNRIEKYGGLCLYCYLGNHLKPKSTVWLFLLLNIHFIHKIQIVTKRKIRPWENEKDEKVDDTTEILQELDIQIDVDDITDDLVECDIISVNEQEFRFFLFLFIFILKSFFIFLSRHKHDQIWCWLT